MRKKSGKAVSRYLGAFIFLLLFLLREAFSNAAYALVGIPFPSSLNTCAANLECAAAISSQVAPAVAAPAVKTAGMTTITATTATGVSTTVKAVVGVAVVASAGVASVVGWHYWDQAQNQRAQERARQRYCTIYPRDSVCYGTWKINGQGWNSEWSYVNNGGPRCSPNGAFVPFTVTGYNAYFEPGRWGLGCDVVALNINGVQSTYHLYAKGTATIQRVSFNVAWKDWPQAKRSIAVAALKDSDWQELAKSMPEGGRLEQGDEVNAPTIVIPGQEADNPNTPADERLLKKVPGFFTNPLDFDYDHDPDESDPDDDDDGKPDSSDPDPQNPLVPEASSDPSSPSPEPSPSPSDSDSPSSSSNLSSSPSPKVPGPGVGGNGTASEFGDMTGMSRADADAFLRSRGATVKTTGGGYTQYKFPDKSEVWIRPSPDNEVVRTPAPRYGPDGSRINKGARLDQNGNLTNPPNHNTGERLRN